MVVLHIDGQCYDISTFWKKHPGGNVICFYDNLDATNAFYTFHAHSKTAKAWLKSLPKKTESLENKDKEFTQLLDSWKAKGLYKSNYYEFLKVIMKNYHSLDQNKKDEIIEFMNIPERVKIVEKVKTVYKEKKSKPKLFGFLQADLDQNLSE